MPTTLRLFFLLMLGFFGLQPVSYGYDAPGSFASGAQNIVAASPESQAAIAESAAPVPLNFNREGAASDRQADTREFFNFVAAETEAGAVAKYGATPEGRPFTKHYGTETGPVRNIPGSVVDQTINTTKGIPVEGGKIVHYDPVNNVTVVTGDGGSIVSVRKGKP